MPDNRPRARKKYVSGGSAPGHSGGHSGGHSSGGGYSSGGYGGGYSGQRSGGGGTILKLILILLLVFGGGGGAMSGFGNLLGGQDVYNSISTGSGTQNGWYSDSNNGLLNTRVSSEARDKYTTIKGLGQDTVTIMVYMCGTDLESRSGMATNDLNEMLSADIADNVNIIVYTGGCAGWRNSQGSSRYNQIRQVRNGKFKCLDKNAGTGAMTDPSTLVSFIKWANKNFPANRRELILWDHGGGSASGYGYDEKYRNAGSMSLANIDKALTASNVKFDFVGFDACLMATTETALMLSEHADYLIGSEETEPGIGWYYTDWLSALSSDTSMETVRIGKQIADDFVATCNQKCAGQPTTLSVVDLAELQKTLPKKLSKFSNEASSLIEDGDYKSVATARGTSREFARSSGIDQIDFIHFAKLTDTASGKELADTLLEAVKYNRTSNNMSNAYGLSIYFPYKALNKVDSVTRTYKAIDMDDEYTSCIRKFAQMQVSGQAVSGGTQSPFGQLFGQVPTSGSGSTGQAVQQILSSGAAQQLIGSLLTGRSIDRANIDGLDASNTEFMHEDALDPETVADYVTADRITADDLKWQKNSDGDDVIMLSEEKWSQVNMIDMNMFYDNGDYYLDLGLDNVFSFDSDNNMLPENDGTWLAINGQPVTYYHDETVEMGGGAYQINGHVPVLLNGSRADLLLAFTNENEQGYIAGVRFGYDESVTDTTAKAKTALEAGDKIKFLYNGYVESGSKAGKKQDNIILGDTLTITDPDVIEITNVKVGSGKSIVSYKFTDIFGQELWTEELE